MNTEEIQTRLDKIADAMIAKGKISPNAQFWMQSQGVSSVYLSWTKSESEAPSSYGSDYKSQSFRADTIPETLDAADAWVASLPTPEEAALADFTNLLAKTIELGNKVGIDPQFVNPLTEAMKRLSENAITFRGDAE